MSQTYLTTAAGKLKEVRHMDALWCKIEKRRVRFVKVTTDEMVVVADESGKVLPDLRHMSQVNAN